MLRDGNVFCRTNHSFVKENVCQQNFLGVYSLYSLLQENYWNFIGTVNFYF